jgi:hypothetical protein
MTRIYIVIAAGLALAVALPAVSAQAQSPRTFVSAAGSDSNPCSFSAPCRHFQAAVNSTSDGGEVDALDPAGYGPITITQAITIEGQGWSYIAPPTGGNGITINAVSGDVTIHGVSLNGAGITGITNGIVFNSGANLSVANCVVQNFRNNGIILQPASGNTSFVIKDTLALNNVSVGVYYLSPSGSNATAKGVIDHVTATANNFGLVIQTTFGGSVAKVTISNSVASNNGMDGVYINNTAPLAVSIDNTTSSGNGNNGVTGSGTANIRLGRSVITGNSNFGVDNETSSNTLFTYQDNRANDNNGGDMNGVLTTVSLH